MKKQEKPIRLVATALCVLFAVITTVTLIANGQPDRLALAAGTVLLVLIPAILERLFRCRFSLPLYLFALVYALGPMLGHCWYFYYTIPWWDKLLHISGGVMFAIAGVYFCQRLSRREDQDLTCVLFALFFSISVSVVWEFLEFGADCFLGMDMQNDRLVTSIHSYLLGNSIGVTGVIEGIRSVSVNGKPLPGYIDIGLIDTMLDMLLESLGALITCVLLYTDRGRHPLIQHT